MQKKTILIPVILAILLTGPVIAAPKTKNPKVEKTTFTNKVVLIAESSSPGEQVTTETGILYVKDAIAIGYIEPNPDLSIDPISGSVRTSLSGTIDLNTMLGSFNGKWTITNEGGTFEGSVVGVVAVATVSGKFVGHGTGDLEGQKIKGSFEGAVDNYIVNLTIQGYLTSK